MKKFSKLLVPLAIVSLFMIINGCSKDDNGDGGPPDYQTLSLTSRDAVTSRIPEGLKNSTDDNAQSCLDWIDFATDWSGFAYNLEPPAGAEKLSGKATDSWSYKWSWNYDGTHVYTVYWDYEETSTKYIWYWGIQFDDGPIYDYMTAWEFKDGSKGEIRYNFEWVCYYDETIYEDCTDLYMIYTWDTDNQGVVTFTLTVESLDEYEYDLKIEVVINPDGSGTVDYYLLDTLFMHWEWDYLGNGSWVWYMGDMEYTESWTV